MIDVDARPLRRRNFARIEIGRHLVRQGDAYWLRFDGNETKTGEPIEAPFPDALVPAVPLAARHTPETAV
jgi:hypothetical protein